MGYGDPYFTTVVLHEALLLALLGFVPGLLASLLLDAGLVWGTGLLMEVTPGRAGLILALTVGMCTLSGGVAIRKLLSADPVELFK